MEEISCTAGKCWCSNVWLLRWIEEIIIFLIVSINLDRTYTHATTSSNKSLARRPLHCPTQSMHIPLQSVYLQKSDYLKDHWQCSLPCIGEDVLGNWEQSLTHHQRTRQYPKIIVSTGLIFFRLIRCSIFWALESSPSLETVMDVGFITVPVATLATGSNNPRTLPTLLFSQYESFHNLPNGSLKFNIFHNLSIRCKVSNPPRAWYQDLLHLQKCDSLLLQQDHDLVEMLDAHSLLHQIAFHKCRISGIKSATALSSVWNCPPCWRV